MSLFNRTGARTSFLERNQLIIGLLAILLVAGGSAFSLLLSGGYFSRTYSVSATFADAAGLKKGDQVKVAGVEAGSVENVAIEDGAVEVTLKVARDVELSKDSSAEITIETLLGKKVVTLFDGSSGDRLEEGDVIPLDRTRTPVELVDIGDVSTELLEASDADALEEFMEGVTEITQGKREDITALIEGLGDAAAAIDDRRGELARLIDSLRILSGTFAERDDTLVNLIDNFDIVLGNLSARTGELQTLLEKTDLASHEIADLVGRNRTELNSVLDGLHTTFQVLDRHQLDLAATISYLEQAVRGYSSVGYSHGIPNRWANIFVQSLGPLGIDAFFGPCGAFDQALDELLGPDPRDCDDRARYGEDKDKDKPGEDDEPRARQRQGQRRPEPDEPDDALPDLPGDIGDLLDSVTGTAGLGDALREAAR